VSNYRIVQHNAWQGDLIPVPKYPVTEGVVRINPEVARADLKLGISSILPHPRAGTEEAQRFLCPAFAILSSSEYHHMKHVIDPDLWQERRKEIPSTKAF